VGDFGATYIQSRPLRLQAQAVVDDAIDDAPEGMALCIIHGTGTGALRSAIQQLLKGHPQVTSFELDPASNGGCTLAYLK
jgi:DNA mismatch repair protein MutS2